MYAQEDLVRHFNFVSQGQNTRPKSEMDYDRGEEDKVDDSMEDQDRVRLFGQKVEDEFLGDRIGAVEEK
jgi:hypothetical protein